MASSALKLFATLVILTLNIQIYSLPTLPKLPKIPHLIPKEKSIHCGGKKCKTCVKSVCKECNPGYGTSPDNSCFVCKVKKCVECNGNQNYCGLCKSFHFFDQMSSLCRKCSLGCESCVNGKLCTKCGFFFKFAESENGRRRTVCVVNWVSLVVAGLCVVVPFLLFGWLMWYKFFSKATRAQRLKNYTQRLDKLELSTSGKWKKQRKESIDF